MLFRNFQLHRRDPKLESQDIFILIRTQITWPMKCDIIRTRICVAWCSLCCGCVCYVECTQLAFARNWIMHLDLFEENQKGITWKCEKPPPPYRNLSDPKLRKGILTDRKHKTRHLRIRLVPFQMTFKPKLRSKVAETYWRTNWGSE